MYGCVPDDGFGLDVLQVYSDGDQEHISPLRGQSTCWVVLRFLQLQGVEDTVVLSGHETSVNEHKFHPVDPSLLFPASRDESMCLWNTVTGVCAAIFAGH